MTNMTEWEPRAWWIRRTPLDDLAEAATNLGHQWRHYRDWERLCADNLEEAQSEQAQVLLEWHRKRIAEAISLLRVAHWRAGMQEEGAKLGDPTLTAKAMAERYTPWPPMQTTHERQLPVPEGAPQDEPANHGDGVL